MRATVLLLSSLLSLGLCAMPADELHPDVNRMLERALRLPPADGYVRLFQGAELHHGSVVGLAAQLETIAADETQDPEVRYRARWIGGTLAWRDGRLVDALELTKQCAGEPELVTALALQARWRTAQLLDALGRTTQAREAYAAVLDEAFEVDPELEARAQLRLALFDLGDPDEGAMTPLAKLSMQPERESAERQRAAIVLALTGHPAEALAVYEPQGEGTARFRQEVRMAEWAIHAEDAARARDLAWRAYRSAELTRDRNYALTVLVEAHRMKDKGGEPADWPSGEPADEPSDEAASLQALIDRFAATEDLESSARQVWIDLLRETGQVDQAIELFASSKDDDEFTPEMQRELLEMYREAEREDDMVAAYRQLIAVSPARIEWREGLSRHFLERGLTAEAQAVWEPYLADEALRPYLLAAGDALVKLGLDDLARRGAEVCINNDVERYPAFMFLFQLGLQRGDTEVAEAALERMHAMAPAASAVRTQLAEAFEQLGRQDRATEVLSDLRDERLRASEGEAGLAEDLEMRLAWLYSEIGEEEQAFERWKELWHEVKSVARRRYAEDRLMTVAARIGKIADIVIDLEKKLAAGEADERDSGLLVRLYTKIGDPVSATEVIEEFMRQSGGDPLELLREKATVYLACTDYASYEETLRHLLELDPEGRVDTLRQLVMSQLERGRPDEARPVLDELRKSESDPETAEFEAGVYALAGLRDDAITAYRRGVARYPDRIESYLLLGKLLAETGHAAEAVGMFQHLAETADRDDLFTIAIDGLLNLEASGQVVQWARRRTLERLATRHDKMYLYQLLSDLAQELEDRPSMLKALEGSLAIAGPRRASILRELMDLCASQGYGSPFASRGRAGALSDRHRNFGRRLIGTGDLVPPQVYLDLGGAFLQADEITSAVKTFALASDLPDQAGFQRQVADLFQKAGYLREALAAYQRVLIGNAGDIGLMRRVARLQEQVGRDDLAFELYDGAMRLLLARRPLSTDKEEKEDDEDGRSRWWRQRNLDEYDQHYADVLSGLLVTLPGDAEASALLQDLQAAVAAEREELDRRAAQAARPEATAAPDAEEKVLTLEQFPRLQAYARLHRRLALACGHIAEADAIDLGLLSMFPGDEDMLGDLVRGRLAWGLVASARGLLDASNRPAEQKDRLRFLVGQGMSGGSSDTITVPLSQATRLFLTPIVLGQTDQALELLQRTDLASVTKEELPELAVLFSAAQFQRAPDLELGLARSWIRHQLHSGDSVYKVTQIYDRCKRSLSGDTPEEKERRRSLDQFVISLIASDPEKTSSLARMLPELQKSSEEPILDPEQVGALLDELRLQYPYGAGNLLMLLPADERSAAVRKLWSKVPKTSQARFLLTLLSEVEEQIPEELGRFILESVTEAFRAMDDPFRYVSHQLTTLEQNRANADLVLAFTEKLEEVKPNEPSVPLLRAVLLQEAGRADEALSAALSVLRAFLAGGQEDYSWHQTFQTIDKRFLPEHLDEFLVSFDEVEEPSVEILEWRLQFIERAEDDERTLTALQDAVAQHQDSVPLLQRLQRHLSRLGRRAESFATWDLILAAEKDDEQKKRLRTQVASAWRRLHHPVNALAMLEAGDEEEQEDAADDHASHRKFEPATILAVKEAMEADDPATAREVLRRLWRFPTFDPRRGMVYMVVNGVVQPMNRSRDHDWPQTEEEEDEPTAEEKERSRLARRGGLAAYVEEVPEPRERQSAYEVLSAHEFATSEMERHLRHLGPGALDSAGFVLKGLRHALVGELGAQGARDGLLAKLAAGTAKKSDCIQLLALLEEHPGDLDEASRSALGDLLRTLDPRDGLQLLRMARAYARCGAAEEAVRIYNWCATLTQRSRWSFYDEGDGFGQVTPQDLVAKAREDLEGDDLYAVIERVLQLAAPDEDDRWAIQGYEQLVFDTWEECVGPALALERSRSICDRVVDTTRSLRRRTALRAAALLARAGELDQAIRCLEVGLCKLPTDGVETTWWWELRQYEQPGALGTADYRRLFPTDFEGFTDPRGWIERASAALEGWAREDRIDASRVVPALVLLAMRRAQLEPEPGEARERDRAAALELTLSLPDLASGDEDLSSSASLWIADAARELGAPEFADGLEAELYAAGRLNRERTQELLSHCLETEGPEAAMKLGEPALEYTRDEDVLRVLTQAATAAGDTAATERYAALAAEAEQATEALKARDEE